MRRYWIEPKSIANNQVIIEGADFRHIFQVCRLRQGEKFEVLSGENQCLLVEVTEIHKQKAVAIILEAGSRPALPEPFIHLAVALPRWSKLEAIIEKSVELGVFALHPFFSDRSFVKKSAQISAGRESRWSRIVHSATQQSGRGDLMKINNCLDLPQLLKLFSQSNRARGLFPYEGDTNRSLKAELRQICAASTATNSFKDPLWVFVGSEGGFTVEEVQMFQDHDLKPFTLGDQVLRVETACLAMVSIIKYEFDLLSKADS